MFACHDGNQEIVRRLLQGPGIIILYKDSISYSCWRKASLRTMYVEMIGAPNTKRKRSVQFIAVKAKRKMQIRNTKYRL